MRHSALLIVVSFHVGVVFAAPPDISSLQAQLDRNPTDVKTWLALGNAFEQAGRESEAIRAYRKAGNIPDAHRGLAKLLQFDDPALAAEHWKKAAALFDHGKEFQKADQCRREMVQRTGNTSVVATLLDREPPDLKLVPELTRLYERCGRPADLLPRLKRYAERTKEPGAQVALAAAEAEAGQTSSAEVRLRPLVAAHGNADAYRTLIRMWADQPRSLEQLLTDLSDRTIDRNVIYAGLEREPELGASIIPVLVTIMDRNFERAGFYPGDILVQMAQRTDQCETAIRLLRTPARGPRSNRLLVLGRLYLWLGKYGEADGVLRRLVEAQDKPAPGLPMELSLVGLHEFRSDALKHLGREKDAIEAAKLATQLARPEQMLQTRIFLMDTLAWFGKDTEMRDIARETLAEFHELKQECDIRMTLSRLAQHAGDFPVVEAHLLRVLELDPHNVTAHNDLGYFWAERGIHLAEAERLCRFALGNTDEDGEPGGDNPAYIDSLGWVFYRQGRLTAARVELERALSTPLGRHSAVLWDHLGDVLWAQGKLPEAKAKWNEALARSHTLRQRHDDRRPEVIKQKLAEVERRLKE
ncbi:MAG: tetratricopeptide repeat protein [Gemmataceae bacterium]